MKKISAILLALIVMLSSVAMAATISVNPPTGDGNESGIVYKAYKVFDAVISGTNVAYTIDSGNQFYTTIEDSGYFDLVQLNGTSTYIVTAKGTYTTEAAKILAGQLKGVAATPDATFSDTERSADVDEGYYLITSTVGDALILDTTQNTSFSTKNSYPTIEKEVNTHSANLGDTVTYTINVLVPANANGTIVVHDTMTGLKYVGMTATAGVTASTDSTCTDGCDVEFTIDAAATKGTTVSIVYTAVVTANTADNEAYLVDGSYTSNPDSTNNDVHNYKFNVFKYTEDAEGVKAGLAGAGFVLKNDAGKYYKYTPATEATNDNPATDAKVEWVESIEDASEYFSAADNDYKVEFVGLANGTYTLVESTVPAGYNAAQNTIVNINGKDEMEVYSVKNSTGSELPSTGGMGTTLFYVVGGLMMAAAVVVLVAKKKVAAK